MGLLVVHIFLVAVLVYFVIGTFFIFVFSLGSFFYRPQKLNQSARVYRFAVLIPSYHEDKVIAESVDSVLAQDYSKEYFDVYVISDGMMHWTDEYLRQKGANVLEVEFDNSSKAKSLRYASERIVGLGYDYVLILDADNVVPSDFLRNINSFINETECVALQTHRKAKKIVNHISYIDAVIEEVNNSIFRKGHNALHCSSSLIGSGMVFTSDWFAENISYVRSAGEDKEIEELLLKQHHYIYYADQITFLDEKTTNKHNIQNQRRRWIASQFELLSLLWKNCSFSLRNNNLDYMLKLVETMILPRSVFVGLLFFLTLISYFIDPSLSIVYALMLLILLLSIFLSIPAYLKDIRFIYALKEIPFLFTMMLLNMFRAKGANKTFIHTEHGE